MFEKPLRGYVDIPVKPSQDAMVDCKIAEHVGVFKRLENRKPEKRTDVHIFGRAVVEIDFHAM